jgi:Uma2 family endonuclease
MNTFVLDAEVVRIPSWIEDLDSFRRWARSDEFPEAGRICYLRGEVWVDMSKEQVFTHNQVKSEFNLVIGGLAKQERLGRYFPEGLLLSNVDADLTAQPDGTFVSQASLQAGRVHFVEGVQEGFVELEGTPDMVLEVLSPSSEEKDTLTLRDLYWQAGIAEYWLVDAPGKRPKLEILRFTDEGYVSSRKQGGWVKSGVFGKSFRLTEQTDPLGHPEYTLAVR